MNVDSRSETNSPRSEDSCILKMKLSSKYLMARMPIWLSVFGPHSANNFKTFLNSLITSRMRRKLLRHSLLMWIEYFFTTKASRRY
jgi:hypothetical protein